MTGHSSGEIAAAYTVGALDMEDAMAVAYYRGVTAGNLSTNHNQSKGAMLAFGMSADDAQTYIDQLQLGKASVACINSPHSVTISGDESAIQELEGLVRDKEVFSRRLAVEVAYHSHHMDPVSHEYLKFISHIKPRSESEIAQCLSNRSVAFYSSVSGTEFKPTELGPEYWIQNLLGQVKFFQSLRTLCFETRSNRNNPNPLGKKRSRRAGTARKVNIDFLVEIGPHAALSGPIKQILDGDSRLEAADITYVSALTRKRQAVATMLTMVATLACSGLPVNFRTINEPDPSYEPHLLVDLPSYPWNHSQSYWAEPRLSKLFRNRKFPRTDILGVRDVMSSPFEPRWRNIIRVSEIPWLMDHKIQSNIVYPAAGYITMAIEAASQVASVNPGDTITGFYLRDISIRSALVLQETSAVEVVVSLRPSENDDPFQGPLYEFHVCSATDDDRWTEHCTGVVGVQSFCTCPSTTTSESQLFIASDMSVLDVQAFYENLASLGLDYGPCFANITQAYYTGGSSLAEITIPDTAASMPMNFQYPHFIHPCTLDGIIHSCFINTDMAGSPAIPVRIEELNIRADFEGMPGNKFSVRTCVTRETKGEIVASIAVVETDQKMAASITGLHCRRIDQGATDPSVKIPSLAYRIEWKADPDMLSVETLSNLLGVSSMLSDGDLERERLYEDYAFFYLRKAISDLEGIHFEGLSPCMKLYLESSVRDEIRVLRRPISELHIESAELPGPVGKALCAMGHNLPAILQGQFSGLTVSNDQSLWDAYWESSLQDPVYESISKYLDLVSHKDPMVSILEIDAGTGLSSWKFLRQLANSSNSPRCSRYTVTSPDETVFEAAAQTLSVWKRWVTFKKLDITEDLKSQGCGNLAYDIVIVPYGLHRVVSIHDALENIHSLLKPGGHLILVNSLQSPVDVILFADREETWIDNRATYSNVDWDMSLKAAQFSGMTALVESGRQRSMIISRPGHDHIPSSAEILLVTEDDDELAAALQDMLLSTSLIVEVTNLQNAKPMGKICIVLCDLNTSVLVHVHKETFTAIKRIFLEASGVLWVTQGGTMLYSNPDVSLVTGFARTARSESAVRRIVTLDLDRRHCANKADISELICRVIERHFLIDEQRAIDDEYAAQDGLLLLPRIIEDTALNRSLATSNDQYILKDEYFQHEGPLRTIYDSVSRPQKVRFVETRSPNLAAGRVRIRVHAADLKQRDAHAVFSTATGHMLGSCCSGIVEAVGNDIHDFVPGDRVTGLGEGTVANVYEDRKTAFYKMPPGMSFESGAALPETYSSALYAMHHLARVRTSDKVLIYLADSTIGKALLELISLQGSQLSLLVDTAADRGLLSTSYNIPEGQILLYEPTIFSDGSSQLCETAGFDVIVNCNYSDNRTCQLLWKYLNRSGRFLQFSDTQSRKGCNWTLPRSQGDVMFASFSLDSVRNMGSDFVDQIWKEVGALLHDGKLHGPVNPATYAFSEINEALDALVSDQPADLIILTAGSKDLIQVSRHKAS